MRKVLILISLLLPFQSLAVDPVIEKHISDAKLVGSGNLSKLFWQIYNAELYAPKGEYIKGKPLALKIEYLRDIKNHEIAEQTIKEIKGQGFNDYQKLSKWREYMVSSIPDVKNGTKITGIYTGDKTTIFYTNGDEEKVINDKDFGQKFFDIWLSPETSEPRLRKKLLGLI